MITNFRVLIDKVYKDAETGSPKTAFEKPDVRKYQFRIVTDNETSSLSCYCSSNVYNCDDFLTHVEAQILFECCGGASNDVHCLDRDGDGLACETLP